MSRRFFTRAVAQVAPLVVFVASASAGQGVAGAVATPTDAAPVIDGVLDDEVWASASVIEEFTQLLPSEGERSRVQTEVRVLVDSEAVYLAAALQDPTGEIRARSTRRDRDVAADWFRIDLDSRHDHTTAYMFQVSASGVQRDALRYDDTSIDVGWDAVWTSAVKVNDDGWTLEVRIPSSAIRFTQGSDEWGMQLTRYIPRLHETSVWSFSASALPGYVSRFGHLGGLKELGSTQRLELRPYVLVGYSGGSAPSVGEDGMRGEAGIDAKLGITSELSLDLTVNPDFGQLEADEVVLNLSKFEPFFPEKRPFFSEGVDILSTPIPVFYSRRIGANRSTIDVGDEITIAGMPATVVEAPVAPRIWAATKLAGKVSREFSLGVVEAVTAPEVVSVRTADAELQPVRVAPARNHMVARGRYATGDSSYVGGSATASTRITDGGYQAVSDNDGCSQGLDAQWQSASSAVRLTGHVLMSERFGGSSYARSSDGAACRPDSSADCVPVSREDGSRVGPGDVGYASTVKMRVQGLHWFADGHYSQFSPKFDLNDLGFSGDDYNKHDVGVFAGYRETAGKGLLRTYEIRADNTRKWDFEGLPLGGVAALVFKGQYSNFLEQYSEVNIRVPGTWDPFETGDGARMERNTLAAAVLGLGTDSSKKISASGEIFGRAEPGGDEWQGAVSGTVRLSPLPQLQLAVSPSVSVDSNVQRMAQCEGDSGAACTSETESRHYLMAKLHAVAASVTVRGTYALSNRLSLQTYAQLFSAHGRYYGYATVDSTGTRPLIYQRDWVASSFNGDFDGDGIKDDDFEEAALVVNAVGHWEYRPGSTLLVAYSHNRVAEPALDGRMPRLDVRSLGRDPGENRVSVKLTYFW